MCPNHVTLCQLFQLIELYIHERFSLGEMNTLSGKPERGRGGEISIPLAFS